MTVAGQRFDQRGGQDHDIAGFAGEQLLLHDTDGAECGAQRAAGGRRERGLHRVDQPFGGAAAEEVQMHGYASRCFNSDSANKFPRKEQCPSAALNH